MKWRKFEGQQRSALNKINCNICLYINIINILARCSQVAHNPGHDVKIRAGRAGIRATETLSLILENDVPCFSISTF